MATPTSADLIMHVLALRREAQIVLSTACGMPLSPETTFSALDEFRIMQACCEVYATIDIIERLADQVCFNLYGHCKDKQTITAHDRELDDQRIHARRMQETHEELNSSATANKDTDSCPDSPKQ